MTPAEFHELKRLLDEDHGGYPWPVYIPERPAPLPSGPFAPPVLASLLKKQQQWPR